MKLFNIFCILCLIVFAFSSCGKYEVIEPEVDGLSNARVAVDVIESEEMVHDSQTGLVGKGGVSENTAEICLVDFSLVATETEVSTTNAKITATNP